MGIQSTNTISRQEAIERIIFIYSIIEKKNYILLETYSFEPEENLQKFVDTTEVIDTSNLCFYTNKMLEDILDKSFFRYSMFDNYSITD